VASFLPDKLEAQGSTRISTVSIGRRTWQSPRVSMDSLRVLCLFVYGPLGQYCPAFVCKVLRLCMDKAAADLQGRSNKKGPELMWHDRGTHLPLITSPMSTFSRDRDSRLTMLHGLVSWYCSLTAVVCSTIQGFPPSTAFCDKGNRLDSGT
jgi:hypothetical protein